MQLSLKAVRVSTVLLLAVGGGWVFLCFGSAAMQVSSDNAAGIFRFAWPPFALSAIVGGFLVTAAHRSERWRPLRSLGWWTLGISVAALALIGLAILFP